MMRGIYAIVVLDMKRFWLDRARLVAGLAQPLLYLFVLGAGIGANSQLGGGDYRRYIFPGVLGLSLLFTATFSAMTMVFDRQIGFFKAVLIAPVPRASIAFGKIIGGALQAFLQGLVVLPFAPLAGVHLPLTKTMIALTFLAGMLPIIGNLISNTVIVLVSFSYSVPMAGISLAFLVTIHKLEYFLNARIIGSHIRARAWELLAAMLVMEAAFGIVGLIAAPIYYAYLKDELTELQLV